MSAISDDESQQHFILAFVMGLIALVIFFVLAIAIHHRSFRVAAAGPAVAAGRPATTLALVTETVTVVIPEGASIHVEGGVVDFYFATASADLAPGAAEALAAVIKGVEDGRKAEISGFHDATGDPALNAQLAKRRADTVRDVLTGLGVPEDQIAVRKPAVTTGSGNNAEARRVEVKLID